jgi:type III secretion protein R
MFQYDPVTLVVGLMILALAPFIAMMITSYVKIVVVLSLLRNALGIQQIPPNMVMNGMAIILTIFIMAPIAQETYNIANSREALGEDGKPDTARLAGMSGELSKPLSKFLEKHSSPKIRLFFLKTALRLWPKDKAIELSPTSFYILVPSFMLTELTEAFQIGFLLYLPFIVIDLVVSNILLAMGMMMVSPMTISLPFKLLLFVIINGWGKVIEGLIMTYM